MIARVAGMATVPAVLAPYVSSLVAYDVDLGAPGVHRGLPTTSLTFVLPMGEPLDVGWADDTARGQRWSTVSGLHAGPAAIHHDGAQRGIQLGLTTAGARALLGVPAGEALAGELLELEDVATDLADLPERLHGPDLAGGLALVTVALVRALARNGEPRPRAEVGRALAGLTRGERVAAWPTRSATAGAGSRAGEGGERAGSEGVPAGRPVRGPPARSWATGRWPTWRPTAGTPTRATSPGVVRLAAAHRARGCARSSHSSKTTRTLARQAEPHDCC